MNCLLFYMRECDMLLVSNEPISPTHKLHEKFFTSWLHWMEALLLWAPFERLCSQRDKQRMKLVNSLCKGFSIYSFCCNSHCPNLTSCVEYCLLKVFELTSSLKKVYVDCMDRYKKEIGHVSRIFTWGRFWTVLKLCWNWVLPNQALSP